VGTDSAILGTDLALVGVEGAQWEYEAPTPDAGEIVWRREGYYTPPETWPKVWNTTPMTGASAYGVTLHSASLIIPVTAGGVPYGGDIAISAVFQNIPTTYEITWGITGASFVDAGTNQTKVVDVTTAFNDSVIVTVSVLFGGVTYTDMLTLTKVYDGEPAPVYLGVHDTRPVDKGGDPLVEGDFFLYMPKNGGVYDDTDPLFGHTLKWDGDSWESTTDSYSIGAAAKDAFQIARETGKVIFAAVIYTEAMVAANIQAGSGTGAAGSGFRFRAMDDDYSQKGNPKVPRFDVMYDNKKLFEVVATGTDAGDVIIGDYANGNGIKYDKSAGKFSVKGTIEAGSSVPYSTVSGAPPSNADNTSTFFESGTAFQTANGKVKIHNDGTIEAVDGVFSGTVNAEQGVFKGSIDSSAFASLPSSGGTTDNITLTSSEEYQVETMADYCQATLTTNRYYACSVSIDSSVKYIRYSRIGSDVDIYFFNSSFTSVGYLRMYYGTFGYAYRSSYEGSSFTVSVSYGAGDVFKFKNLPTSSTGLTSGQVWRDGTTLKIVT